MLVDTQIRQLVRAPTSPFNIEPFRESNVQPASYDLTLGNEIVTYAGGYFPVDLDNPEVDGDTTRIDDDPFVLKPNQFCLAHTDETVSLPDRLSAEVKGRSSIGRLGLIAQTAGWIDPGFEGQITLELVNHGPKRIEIEAGDPIAQIVFNDAPIPAATPYGEQSDSKYQGQSGVTETRMEADE